MIFRRVTKIHKRDFLEVRYYVDIDSYEIIDDDDLTKYRESEYEKNVEERYNMYRGMVSKSKLRDNDKYAGESIAFYSQTYSEFVFLELDFVKATNYVPPRPGDLICGIVSRTDKGLVYDNWFNCSDQFLRTWTAIMYDKHDIFPRIDLRKWLFTGNRLTTNNYYKWLMSHHDENGKQIKEVDQEEQRKRYFRLRTESASKSWLHTYAAVVLMVRYGEYPTNENIPKVLNRKAIKFSTGQEEQYTIPNWDLPPQFVDQFLEMHSTALHLDYALNHDICL